MGILPSEQHGQPCHSLNRTPGLRTSCGQKWPSAERHELDPRSIIPAVEHGIRPCAEVQRQSMVNLLQFQSSCLSRAHAPCHFSMTTGSKGQQQSGGSSTNCNRQFTSHVCLAGHGWRTAGHLVCAWRGPCSLPRPCCAGCSHSPESGAHQVVRLSVEPALPPGQKHRSVLIYLAAAGSFVWVAVCSQSPGQQGTSRFDGLKHPCLPAVMGVATC